VGTAPYTIVNSADGASGAAEPKRMMLADVRSEVIRVSALQTPGPSADLKHPAGGIVHTAGCIRGLNWDGALIADGVPGRATSTRSMSINGGLHGAAVVSDTASASSLVTALKW